MKNITNKIKFGSAVIMVSIAVILMIVFTYFVLIFNNQNSAKRTGKVMINQVSSVLEKNRSDEENLLDSLKEDYIIRAKTVSYILEHHPGAECDIDELNKIAELMGIDEIHIFDQAGTIYAGTIPKYYGLSIFDGEQIGYFKPMLGDKTLSMCQDVTPNTAEKRNMMYATVWDSHGEKMIQVGIEPLRLLEELKNNQISNVIDSMPVYEDINIYVADAESGEILGCTNNIGGKTLEEIGIGYSEKKDNDIVHFLDVVNGHTSECSLMKDSQYIICVVQDNPFTRRETFLSMLIVTVCLIVAAVTLLILLRRLLIIRNEQIEQLKILTSMSEIYYSMHIINLKQNTIKEYSARNQVKEAGDKYRNMDAATQIEAIMKATMTDEYLEPGLEFTDITTMAQRMKGKKVIFMDLLGRNFGWIRMSLIAIGTDEKGKIDKVICTTQIIDEEKRKEERLILESTTDKLTHCFNRRAYENDLHNYPDAPTDEDFVFVSIDVNGLKVVNDTMGHAAGDELLKGVARCMKHCFGRWGKVYRIGGDEFAIILSADSNRLEGIKENFEETINNWSGKIVKSLSVSCGYVTKKEYHDSTVAEMAQIADDRMYEAKAEYYRKIGVSSE
ncbi:MAG: GGDEF domain-containing protein [Lachnospira sp.]